jgi:hypothetical protein
MKRALLVGINQYQQTQFNLAGCVNDVLEMGAILKDVYGFGAEEIQLVTDAQATRSNIMDSLTNLLSGTSAGDQLLFYFAGHGTQKGFEVDGEPAGRDQAIVPYEITMNSLVTDNELFGIIAPRLDPDVKFTAFYDCCHSGTMVRFVDFDEAGELQVFQNRCIDLSSLPGAVRAAEVGPYNVLSACKDEQTAADLKIDGVPRGAFSYALQAVLREEPGIRIADCDGRVLERVKKVSAHKQEPQYYYIEPNAMVLG